MPQKPKRRQRPDADRRLRQADRLARVLRLLQLLLQRGSSWQPRSLAAEQECSERTVYRDLNVLELAGVPWQFDQDQSCYVVRPDFRFPVLNLTDEEVIGQATAAMLTSAPGLTIGAGAKPTAHKLAAASREEISKLFADAARVVAVLDLKLADHSRHQEIIRTVQWALLQGKQLSGQYQSPYLAKPVRLTLHPYRLCLVKQAWYLIARPVREERPKTYRVMRFKTLRMLDAAAEVPPDFDLKEYFGNAWAVYRGQQSYDVAIEFTSEAAPLVTETTWHPTQQVQRQRGGRVTLRFQVDGLEEILWWVLGWSGRVRIIQPAELRTLAVEQWSGALRMNQS